MNDILMELEDYMENHPIINTHSHHLQDHDFKGFNLDAVLRQSYVNWYQVPLEDTYQSRANYLEKNRYNSYFVWLEKSLQELYEFNEPLTADNWDEISGRIEEAYRDEKYF